MHMLKMIKDAAGALAGDVVRFESESEAMELVDKGDAIVVILEDGEWVPTP